MSATSVGHFLAWVILVWYFDPCNLPEAALEAGNSSDISDTIRIHRIQSQIELDSELKATWTLVFVVGKQLGVACMLSWTVVSQLVLRYLSSYLLCMLSTVAYMISHNFVTGILHISRVTTNSCLFGSSQQYIVSSCATTPGPPVWNRPSIIELCSSDTVGVHIGFNGMRSHFGAGLGLAKWVVNIRIGPDYTPEQSANPFTDLEYSYFQLNKILSFSFVFYQWNVVRIFVVEILRTTVLSGLIVVAAGVVVFPLVIFCILATVLLILGKVFRVPERTIIWMYASWMRLIFALEGLLVVGVCGGPINAIVAIGAEMQKSTYVSGFVPYVASAVKYWFALVSVALVVRALTPLVEPFVQFKSLRLFCTRIYNEYLYYYVSFCRAHPSVMRFYANVY